MITDDLMLYMMFQLILFGINVVGYLRIPYLLFFGLIGTVLVSVPTINAFGDYYYIALVLILLNISLPVMGLAKALK
jgi:hypothetical protein